MIAEFKYYTPGLPPVVSDPVYALHSPVAHSLMFVHYDLSILERMVFILSKIMSAKIIRLDQASSGKENIDNSNVTEWTYESFDSVAGPFTIPVARKRYLVTNNVWLLNTGNKNPIVDVELQRKLHLIAYILTKLTEDSFYFVGQTVIDFPFVDSFNDKRKAELKLYDDIFKSSVLSNLPQLEIQIDRLLDILTCKI